MRIRKNAKISPLLYAAASLSPGIISQPHICQLNQSPWDVMSFSPPSSPPYQENGNDNYAGNGSSRGYSIAVLEREAESSSNNVVQWEEDSCGATATEAEQPSDDPNNPTGTSAIILCCKTDGKSWKCRRQAAKGNSLCDHHLSMVRSYSSSALITTKNSSKPTMVEGRRRPMVKKSAAPSSSNPYVFYYYSGFGPHWGKKRGEEGANNHARDGDDYLDRRHYMEPSNLSETDEEFEYEEDDDDQDEYQNGKKRTRKRVKARSLKSL